MSATPPAPAPSSPTVPSVLASPAVAGLLAALGPWGAIAELALTFGVPFVEKIISNSQNNVPVTVAEWETLKTKIALSYDQLPGGA
jgi:hypothetical protein